MSDTRTRVHIEGPEAAEASSLVVMTVATTSVGLPDDSHTLRKRTLPAPAPTTRSLGLRAGGGYQSPLGVDAVDPLDLAALLDLNISGGVLKTGFG